MIKQITKLYLTLFLLLLSYGIFAQVNEGGTPYSFQTVLEKDVPTIQLPKLDMDKIRKEDETKGFTRDGVGIELGIHLNNAGKWTALPNGDRLWRVNIKTEDAIFLILTSTKFFIPEGGKLFMYNKSHTRVYGAYTNKSNNSLNSFTSPDMKSNEITIEYYEPADIKGKSIIEIDRVYQGYELILPEITDNQKQYLYNKVKGFNNSQSCHINAQCDTYDVWEQQRRSVARIRIIAGNSTGYCSGALINNTAGDGKPYFLSAWHCQAGGTPNYNNWRFDFEYEHPTCLNANEPTPVTVTGATELVKAQASDVLLLELSSLPAGNNYYLAGWNRANTPASSAFGFHHPAGDVKKASRTSASTFSNPSPSTFGGLAVPLTIPAGNLWGCIWNEGTTEGGSSGSPLFDNNQRIVGQLTGGNSSCTNLGGNNWYGKLSSSWSLVSSYLDPNNSGVIVLDGFDGNITLTNNMRVREINVDTSPCLFTNSTPVEVVIENFGSATQSNIPVAYELVKTSDNSMVTGNQTFMGSLATGQSTIVTFNVNMEDRDEYIFTARTELVGDELVGDDQKQENYENIKPTIGASNIQITGADEMEGFTVSWTRGNGENSIVLVKEGSDFTPSDLPIDGDSYVANSIFPIGDPAGDAIVVYKGDANTVTVSKLDKNEVYYVAVIEFSCIPEDYLLEEVEYNSETVTNLETELANKIDIYPNPASDNITIDFKRDFTMAKLQFSNTAGKVVKETIIKKQDRPNVIDLKDLSSGMYILNIMIDNRSYQKKIFIK